MVCRDATLRRCCIKGPSPSVCPFGYKNPGVRYRCAASRGRGFGMDGSPFGDVTLDKVPPFDPYNVERQ